MREREREGREGGVNVFNCKLQVKNFFANSQNKKIMSMTCDYKSQSHGMVILL